VSGFVPAKEIPASSVQLPETLSTEGNLKVSIEEGVTELVTAIEASTVLAKDATAAKDATVAKEATFTNATYGLDKIKTDTAAIKSKTDLFPASPMPAAIPSQAFPFTNPAALLSLLNIRLLADCGPYALSDDVLFAHDAEGSLDAQSYTTVKEINVGYFKGTIRIAFSIGCDTTHDTHGRLYKNGVDTEQEGNNGGGYYEYKFDIAVAANDLIELKVFNTTPGYPVKFKNFRILGKFPVPVAPAITV
jgi:hypothetical protein